MFSVGRKLYYLDKRLTLIEVPVELPDLFRSFLAGSDFAGGWGGVTGG